MFFYINKIYNNENEQTQLLEMCHHTGFRFGNGQRICGIGNYTYFIYKLRENYFRNFLFID